MESLINTVIAVLGIKTVNSLVEFMIHRNSKQERCVVHAEEVQQKQQLKCAMKPTTDISTLARVIVIGTMAMRVCVETLTPVISMPRRCVVPVKEGEKLLS